MSVIVGLGNVGQEYEGTRHNIGFEVVDAIAESLKITFEPGNGPYVKAEGRYKGRKLVLIKPTNFMNRSGSAVRKALAHFSTDIKDCLIIYDDLNLPVGSIRMKPGGSDGGHNGIADIIEKLNTRDFARLRVGIGNDFKRGQQVDFVLSSFNNDERIEMDISVQKVQEATLAFVHLGLAKAMNFYN